MCSSPRANHASRTVPKPKIVHYAKLHDDAVWLTLDANSHFPFPRAHFSALLVAKCPRTRPLAGWATYRNVLTAGHAEPASTSAPHAMQMALQRRLRLPLLPISSDRCEHAGELMGTYGDHALTCTPRAYAAPVRWELSAVQ